jgi:hypothetical protein
MQLCTTQKNMIINTWMSVCKVAKSGLLRIVYDIENKYSPEKFNNIYSDIDREASDEVDANAIYVHLRGSVTKY